MVEHSEHVKTRNKIKQITETSTFNELLDKVMLPQKYKELLQMFYLNDMTFIEIGEKLGIEEITAKMWHKKSLRKINKLI